VIKLFVPEDSQETRKVVKAALKEHA
jgi:hypothetical protein